jgi:hypothetical protein
MRVMTEEFRDGGKIKFSIFVDDYKDIIKKYSVASQAIILVPTHQYNFYIKPKKFKQQNFSQNFSGFSRYIKKFIADCLRSF